MTDGLWGQSPGHRSLPTQINTSLAVTAVWPQHQPPRPPQGLHDGQRFPASPPSHRPTDQSINQPPCRSQTQIRVAPVLSRLLTILPTLVLFFFVCFVRSRPVPPLCLAKESWLAPLGQRGQPDSCGPADPHPPLRSNREGR